MFVNVARRNETFSEAEMADVLRVNRNNLSAVAISLDEAAKLHKRREILIKKAMKKLSR